MNPHILLVEDDEDFAELITTVLKLKGYQVTRVFTVAKGIESFSETAFDLAILDLTLPDGSGLSVCEKIRSHPKRFSTPVIILTGDTKFESKIAGFHAGADQYLAKPFSVEELALWVSALLKRLQYNEEAKGVIALEGLQIDPNTHVVKFHGSEVTNLTRKEFDLLYHLIASRPKVLSKNYILSKLWHTVLTDNTVEVHIHHIREKLGPEANLRILTIPGKGYKFI